MLKSFVELQIGDMIDNNGRVLKVSKRGIAKSSGVAVLVLSDPDSGEEVRLRVDDENARIFTTVEEEEIDEEVDEYDEEEEDEEDVDEGEDEEVDEEEDYKEVLTSILANITSKNRPMSWKQLREKCGILGSDDDIQEFLDISGMVVEQGKGGVKLVKLPPEIVELLESKQPREVAEIWLERIISGDIGGAVDEEEEEEEVEEGEEDEWDEEEEMMMEDEEETAEDAGEEEGKAVEETGEAAEEGGSVIVLVPESPTRGRGRPKTALNLISDIESKLLEVGNQFAILRDMLRKDMD